MTKYVHYAIIHITREHHLECRKVYSMSELTCNYEQANTDLAIIERCIFELNRGIRVNEMTGLLIGQSWRMI